MVVERVFRVIVEQAEAIGAGRSHVGKGECPGSDQRVVVVLR